MNESGAYLIAEASMLTCPTSGIHTIWQYWSDGTVTEKKVPLGPPVLFKEIFE